MIPWFHDPILLFKYPRNHRQQSESEVVCWGDRTKEVTEMKGETSTRKT